MICDGFMFCNELEVLDVRLHYLDPFVGRFVLVESPMTHSGKKKPLYYDENKSEFKRFSGKIMHIVHELKPVPQDELKDGRIPDLENHIAWENEQSSRNAIIAGTLDLDDSDILIVSDLDEIPMIESVPRLLEFNQIVWFEMILFYYYTNVMQLQTTDKAFALNMATARRYPLSHIRWDCYYKRLPQSVRKSVVKRSGWHLSYMGGVDRIMEKVGSFAEANANPMTRRVVERCLRTNEDLLGRKDLLRVKIDVEEEKYYTKDMLAAIQRHKCLLKPRDAREAEET